MGIEQDLPEDKGILALLRQCVLGKIEDADAATKSRLQAITDDHLYDAAYGRVGLHSDQIIEDAVIFANPTSTVP